MAEETEPLAPGSSILFGADAQAILEEAPNLDLGLELLNESYGSEDWDDKVQAKNTAAEYAQLLRHKFEDDTSYSAEDIESLAPVDFNDVPTTEDPEEQISAWEEANLAFLDQTEDPEYLMVRDKLKTQLAGYASNLRRESHGKDQGWLSDKFYRASLGLTGGIAKLVGADGYVKELQERTDPSRDDDFSSALASGAGSVAGAIGAGAAAVATGPISGPVAAGAYLFASGAGEVRETYEESLARTGDSNRALIAGAIETGSQAFQTVVGGKVFGSSGKLLAKKILGKEVGALTSSAVGQITKKGLAEGATEAAGNVVSNYADKYGTRNKNIDIFDNTGTNFLVGMIFGGGAGALDVVAAKSNPAVEPGINPTTGVTQPLDTHVVGSDIDIETTEQIQTNTGELALDTNTAAPKAETTADFVTSDGSRYLVTEDGATARFKEKDQTQRRPLDRTFYVNSETATKLAALRSATTPDGSLVQILTDGDELLVKSGFVDENLQVTETPTGRRLTRVPMEEGAAAGLHPVEVNRPKNVNGNQREYRSHIGQPITSVTPRTVVIEQAQGGSVGAAFTKERKLGARLRLSEGLQESIRSGFGDEEGGFLVYMPQPRAETTDTSGKYIADRGVEAATTEILSLPENYASAEAVETTRQLVQFYNEGTQKALAVGDTQAAENMADVAINLGEKAAQILTNAGQTVDIARLWQQFDPNLRLLFVRKKLREKAVSEVASEEGISTQELLNTDKELAQTEQQVAEIQQTATQAEDIVTAPLEKDIQDSTKLIGEIEKAGSERHKEFVEQEKSTAEAAEKEADALEQEATAQVETERTQVEESITAAEERIKAIEEQAQTKTSEESETEIRSAELLKSLEERGKAQAEKELDSEIEKAESAVSKLEGNKEKGAKVSPPAIASAKKGLAELKTRKKNVSAEDGLNPEEKKELRRLRRLSEKKVAQPKKASVLSASETKELEKLKGLVSKGREKLAKIPSTVSDTQKEKIKRLRDFAKDKREKVASTPRESFLNAKEKRQLENLSKTRDKAREAKAKIQRERNGDNYLTEAQKDRLKDLTEKTKRLKERQNKISAKKKEKLSKFSPEQQARMKKLLTAAGKHSGSTQQQLLREALKIEQEVGAQEKLAGFDLAHTYWQLNILSDPSTQAVNAIGNASQVLGTTLSYLATGVPRGKTDGIDFMRGLVRGALAEGRDAFWAELGGVKTFRPESEKLEGKSVKSTRGVSDRPDFVRDTPDWVKKIGLNNLGYVFRALSATDAFFYKSLQEGQAQFIARQMAEGEGLKGDALRTRVSEILNNSTENYDVALKEANSEADLLKELGIPMSPRQVRLRAWELLEAKRPESLRQEVHTFAAKSTFTNTPDGTVGGIIRTMQFLNRLPVPVPYTGKTIKPFRYIFPFMNVAGNILNANLDYFIGGAIRATDFQNNLSANERRNAAGKFMLGTMLTGSLYGIAREFLDDEDPSVAVYGAGPPPGPKRDTWLASGAKPYSVKVGDTYVRYSETPLGIVLGALGSWMDAERWNKTYARSSGLAAADIILGGMGKAFTDNSFLKNIAEFVGALSGDKDKSYTNALLVNPIKGFIPAVGTLRAISKLIEDPIDTHNDFWAKFVSGIPGVQNVGTRPALNHFGEPIERSFEDRLSFIGRFYSERVTDPEWRWLAENGYYLPDTGGFTLANKGTGSAKKRSAELGAAFENVLNLDQRYEFIRKSGPLIKAKVNEYREKYGTSGYQEKIQERLSHDIGDIRSRVKYDMFVR